MTFAVTDEEKVAWRETATGHVAMELGHPARAMARAYGAYQS